MNIHRRHRYDLTKWVLAGGGWRSLGAMKTPSPGPNHLTIFIPGWSVWNHPEESSEFLMSLQGAEVGFDQCCRILVLITTMFCVWARVCVCMYRF